jgi:hypothetical protein
MYKTTSSPLTIASAPPNRATETGFSTYSPIRAVGNGRKATNAR